MGSATGSSLPLGASGAAGTLGGSTSVFDRLPDDVLLAILSGLMVAERTRLARVSRRFCRLSTSPELLPASLEVSILSRSRLDVRAASLRAWLQRHALVPRLRQLSLTVRQDVNMSDPPAAYEEPQARQALAELRVALLAAFGGGFSTGEPGALQLWVSLAGPFCLDASWLPALRGLSSLELGGNISQVSAPLQRLTQLRSFSLCHNMNAIGTMASGHTYGLPASLTSLALLKDHSFSLPQAVGQLTLLEELKLQDCSFMSSAFDCLVDLPALRRLSLVNCDRSPEGLPRCLPALTRLEGLHWQGGYVFDDPEEAAQELDFQLSPLTQLTYLWFHDTLSREDDEFGELFWERIPSALLGMTRLHTLGWLLPPSEAALPGSEGGGAGGGGSWLAGLRALALPADVAQRSLGQLHQATALETLCVTGWAHSSGEQQAEVLGLAGQLPSLRRLSYQAAGSFHDQTEQAAGLDLDILAAAAAARSSSPQLHIDAQGSALLAELQCGYA
ncbi:hypothetical protein ABPG75_004082 [Micractinium tetrahymenae]